MGRKPKDNPTHMSTDDVADTLRTASSDLIEAQEGLKAARQPIHDAKAQIKATGIDFDIFSLCHGIRHLEDDDARQKRIGKLQIAVHALLGDRVQLDMFGFVAQVKPAVKEALKKASDTLREVEPAGEAAPANETGDELPFDPPSTPALDEPEEDVPALVAAESMPEGAGYAFNNGVKAGRKGFDADANPHAPESAEAALWERGRAQGAAQASRFVARADGEGGRRHQLLCDDDVVFEHPDLDLVMTCCATLNSAEIEAADPLTPVQIREAVRPHLDGGFGVVFEGRFAPDAEERPATTAPALVEFTGSTSAKRVQAYFYGYDGAEAEALLADLIKGRRGEIKAQIEAGFTDRTKGEPPRHQRPEERRVPAGERVVPGEPAIEASTQPDGPAEDSDENGQAGTDEAEDAEEGQGERLRVGVREVGGKHVLFDLHDEEPLMDVSGPKTGETWANQINAHFADRLDTVTRTDLINAAKTLACGRMLMPPPPAAPGGGMFAAV